MAEAKIGERFIKHELDEAIAIQQCIVEAEQQLSQSHPEPEAKRAMKTCLKEDERFLKELQKLGKPLGATGEVEDVAGGLKQLMEQTLRSANEAESEAYEAHAVLLNLKRKQQDSAGAMIKIARQTKNTAMRTAAMEFEKSQKQSSKELAGQLANLAVKIAAQGSSGARA
jgi:hypothetical protein